MSETNISEMSGHADSTIPETLKEKLHHCEALCKELENLAGCPGVDVQAECGRLQNEFSQKLVQGFGKHFCRDAVIENITSCNCL